MKKIIILLLSVYLVLTSSVSNSEQTYYPGLDMTMDDFIMRYNSLGTALGSPLVELKMPLKWTVFNDYRVAWFYPSSDNPIILFLMTKEKDSGNTTASGLDRIQIEMDDAKDFIAFLTVSDRCASIFSEQFFGMTMSEYCIYDMINYYYENNAEKKGTSSYRQLDSEAQHFLNFFKDRDSYCIEIYGSK